MNKIEMGSLILLNRVLKNFLGNNYLKENKLQNNPETFSV